MADIARESNVPAYLSRGNPDPVRWMPRQDIGPSACQWYTHHERCLPVDEEPRNDNPRSTVVLFVPDGMGRIYCQPVDITGQYRRGGGRRRHRGLALIFVKLPHGFAENLLILSGPIVWQLLQFVTGNAQGQSLLRPRVRVYGRAQAVIDYW